ncbi:MAG: HAD-IA family hydrolase [Candidatus Dormibacteraeota bacterium]|nr:HAD-IA family hydrolase [Candidatus Dormibacteraeota bacterium]
MGTSPTPGARRDGEAGGALRAVALLFDLDGTLVDSTALITRAWTRWAVEEGLSRESFVGVPLHGRPARDIVHDLVPDREKEALRRILDIEASTEGGVRTLPGADRLLNQLSPDEWAVVTSGSGRIAEPRLAALPVRPRVVVTSDDVDRGKPDPEPFLLAARRLGITEPASCVVLEDAPAGLAAAAAAGMRSVAVVTTHRRDQLSATVVIPDLDSLQLEHDAGNLLLKFPPSSSTRG